MHQRLFGSEDQPSRIDAWHERWYWAAVNIWWPNPNWCTTLEYSFRSTSIGVTHMWAGKDLFAFGFQILWFSVYVERCTA